MSLFQILYDCGPNGLWVFLLVSIVMGCSTAYVSGKAIAETWRPAWHAIVYALIVGLAVRFIHFALFEEVLLSLRNYIVDCAALIATTVVGYQWTRKRQMEQQYGVLRGTAAPGAPNA
jgi:hypothetical protein